MFNSKKFDELTQKITQMVPGKLRDIPGGMQKTIAGLVQSTLAKMDLVTREEFDVQVKVLQRTRSKLEALEQVVAELTGKSKAELDQLLAKHAPVEDEKKSPEQKQSVSETTVADEKEAEKTEEVKAEEVEEPKKK